MVVVTIVGGGRSGGGGGGGGGDWSGCGGGCGDCKVIFGPVCTQVIEIQDAVIMQEKEIGVVVGGVRFTSALGGLRSIVDTRLGLFWNQHAVEEHRRIGGRWCNRYASVQALGRCRS